MAGMIRVGRSVGLAAPDDLASHLIELYLNYSHAMSTVSEYSAPRLPTFLTHPDLSRQAVLLFGREPVSGGRHHLRGNPRGLRNSCTCCRRGGRLAVARGGRAVAAGARRTTTVVGGRSPKRRADCAATTCVGSWLSPELANRLAAGGKVPRTPALAPLPCAYNALPPQTSLRLVQLETRRCGVPFARFVDLPLILAQAHPLATICY